MAFENPFNRSVADRSESFQPQGFEGSRLGNQAAKILSSAEGAEAKMATPTFLNDGFKLPGLEIGSGKALAAVTHLDSKQPVSDLVKAGKISDSSNGSAAEQAERKLEAKPAYDKTPPKISVGLQNIDGTPQSKPHFLIKENGEIEMRANPEKLNPKDIKIVLDRKDGQLNPTDAQVKSAETLVKYLSERVQKGNVQARRGGMELDDKDDVISDEGERSSRLRSGKDLRNVTPETRQSVEQTHRFKGANGVDMPRSQTDRMGSFGTREVNRLPAESDRTMGIKESVAGLWKPDRTEPYDTARKHPDGGVRVGRYGFSGKQINSFLESIGDPPDPAAIEKLIKEGKLPKDFAEKMKNPDFLSRMKGLAEKLNAGQMPEKGELKELLPKRLQEGMESSMIEDAKKQVGDRPGAIAAGLLSGKPAKELSKADAITPEGKQLSEAGDRLFELATQRKHSEAQVAGKIPQGQKRELIEEALTKAGVPVTRANLQAVDLIVSKESTWNPNAVNNWDSNARRGTPSKGLMQTIGPTFNSYSIPGHKNILNPVDNMIAGIRYSVDRYGSLQNVPGVKAVARGARYRGY